MTKFEMGDDFKVRIGDQDLSGYVDHIKPMSQLGDEDESNLRVKLAGLQQFSHIITFDEGLDADGLAELAQRYESGRGRWSRVAPITPVKYECPDGRWQAFKHRLKYHWPRCWPFRRLKVRYRSYSFDASLESWQDGGEFDLSGTTTGPVSMGIEER